MGLLTPPVCVGVYTAAAVAKTSPEKAFREVPAFLGVTLVYATIMVLVAPLSTFLASLA
jgi:C4-dicarboxylate transporter DctM subunit